METHDYHRLKSIFDSTKRSRGKPSSIDALDFYTRDVRQLWEEDSEDFYRKYYFPERDTLTPISTSENSINTSSYTRSSLPLNRMCFDCYGGVLVASSTPIKKPASAQ